MKSINSHKILGNPRALWDRVKVFLRASFRLQRLPQAANLRPLKAMKSYEILRNTYKSMKMHEINEIS